MKEGCEIRKMNAHVVERLRRYVRQITIEINRTIDETMLWSEKRRLTFVKARGDLQ